MTDEKRCEPPGHLRGSDGEHFVCGPNGLPFVALWNAAPHAGIEPLWQNAARTSTGTPAWAANEWGWRYLAPVTPPATVAALVEALEWMIANDDTNEGDMPIPELGGQTWDEFNAYWIAGLNKARAALTLYRETGR